MCDTIIVTGEATRDGAMLFGKNSDREPNEAHQLLRVPALDHVQPATVKCTYIEIPQVDHTYEVLLAKPFWIWGAEMGANEHGVVIGNEAVFTRVPRQHEGGLLGMDLLRLALERAANARAAITVITELLSRYGQGGNCGFTSRFFYHNSYLIADPGNAWLLETAGPHWAAKQLHGIYTISNGLTISDSFDLASDDLIEHAVRNKWCSNESDFSFTGCYSNKTMSRLSSCVYRRSRTAELLAARNDIGVADIMSVLRDHGSNDPRKGITRSDVCMHAGTGRIRRSQTTGSMVSQLTASNPVHFLTGTAAPCTSLFKPVWTDTSLAHAGPPPTGTFNRSNLYWQHEKLHRQMLLDLPGHAAKLKKIRDQFEAEMISTACDANEQGTELRQAISHQYFDRCKDLELQQFNAIQSDPKDTRPILYKRSWRQINSAAEMPG